MTWQSFGTFGICEQKSWNLRFGMQRNKFKIDTKVVGSNLVKSILFFIDNNVKNQNILESEHCWDRNNQEALIRFSCLKRHNASALGIRTHDPNYKLLRFSQRRLCDSILWFDSEELGFSCQNLKTLRHFVGEVDRCQFHQHFYVQIFRTNGVLAAFSSYVLALAKNSYEKYARLMLMKLTAAFLPHRLIALFMSLMSSIILVNVTKHETLKKIVGQSRCMHCSDETINSYYFIETHWIPYTYILVYRLTRVYQSRIDKIFWKRLPKLENIFMFQKLL